MLRLLIIFVLVAFFAGAIAWFADRPGEITVSWLGYEIRTSFMFALASVLMLFLAIAVVGTILRGVLGAPGLITNFFRNRRHERGLAALTKGVVAAGAGDAAAARRYASLAHRSLGDVPLAQLLRAQAAQLSGDRSTVQKVFDQMLGNPETEVLGLRGLFVQAQQDDQPAKARAYAERALAINPRLAWAARAALAMQSAAGEWGAAEQTIEDCRRHKLFDTEEANRKLAVVATARAMRLEDAKPDAALEQALTAHRLAPELVPAAAIAGRILAATGQERKASKVLEKTWRLAPHPDLAEIYGAVYTGRSPRERLKRVKTLVAKAPSTLEGPVAVARAAVEAQAWEEAREALEPVLEEAPSARVFALMAEIEHGEHADEGRARQWLARAMHAPRDPAWVADGYVSETWAPMSPQSGELDAFEWKVPAETAPGDGDASSPARAPALAAAPAAETTEEKAVEPEAEPEAVAEPEPAVAEEAKPKAPVPSAGEDGGKEEREAAKPEARPARPSAGEQVYVPPRAPDDPGPEPREEESGNWFQTLFAR